MVIGALPREYATLKCIIHFYLIGAFVQVVGYALAAPAPPFPVFVLGYAMNGFGLSLQVDSQRRFAPLALRLNLSIGRERKRLRCFLRGRCFHEIGRIARRLQSVTSSTDTYRNQS